MKRDLDLIREILFYIEKMDDGNGNWITDLGDLEKIDIPKFNGHMHILFEASYIEALAAPSDENRWIPKRLTVTGHDYLDSVRDPKIWKSTKSKLSKVGGSTTLAVIQAVATKLAMQAMGLDT